jgi:integrase
MARKRRGRGEGGVFQRPDGQWVGVLSQGFTAAGKRRRKVVYGKTKAEAQAKLRNLQSQADSGTLGDAGAMTLGQFLTHWLEVVHKPQVQQGTYDRNELLVRLHLGPRLGTVRLCKLSELHVERFLAEMIADGHSASCSRRCGRLLRTALKHAAKKRLIARNPALDVPLPRAAKAEMTVYDAGQAAAFLKAARADRLFALYVLALDTGMRQGELFGLQWPDFDFEGGSVQVQRSLQELKGKHKLKEPKTAKARRRIDLSRFALAVMLDHRKAMLAEGHVAGPVFCDTEGGFLRKSNLQRNSFKPTIKRANRAAVEDAAMKGSAQALLPEIRFHDLRHTSATLLLMANVNVKIVSERLGHSNVELTLNCYSHVLPTMQKKAAEAMDGIFGKSAV